MRDMLTIEEAAAELGLASATLRVQVSRGVIRSEKVGRRLNLISRMEVERYRAESLGRTGRPPKGGQE